MLTLLHQITNMLGRMPKSLLFGLCMAIIALFGYIDYKFGYEISITVMYLLPILVVSWHIGIKSAFVASLFSAITWFLADVHSGHRYPSILYPLWNSGIKLSIFMMVMFIIRKLRLELELIKDLSMTDPLTGCRNRKFLYTALGNELERSRRTNAPVTIAYLDLDNFKQINDTRGHKTGDEVLKTVSGCIAAGIRTIDSISRIGGDEFVILLVDVSPGEARTILRRILTALKKTLHQHGFTAITCSVGAVTCTKCGHSVDEIMEKSDKLMYQVKQSGKNNIKFLRL